MQHLNDIKFHPKHFNFYEAVTPDTISTSDEPKIDFKKSRLACWLSHINIWKKYQSECKPVLIIEDDVRFNKNFQLQLNQILNKLNTMDWDMCFLGRVEIENQRPNESLKMCNLEWIKNAFFQTHCYLINANKIPKLLELCEPKYIKTNRKSEDFAIDVCISDLNKENKIKVLGVKQQLANQISSNEYGSSTM
jgi:GR25 family glycosyltransferase involved in LPS biosynthesis